MRLSIRYDDNFHKKLKILAAYKSLSLNKLILKALDKEISEWEETHGKIEIPE